MKYFFYTLLISSYLAAGTINTTTMLDKTYHCVEPDEYGLIDLTFIKNGLAHVNPLFDLGSAFEYSVEGNLIFLSEEGESLKLSNATENSFDMFISDDEFITERLLWSCHDNIEDSFTEADATLPAITNSTITIDGIVGGAEWDGMVVLDATKTIGTPIDITTMKLAKDSNYIYIMLQTDNNI